MKFLQQLRQLFFATVVIENNVVFNDEGTVLVVGVDGISLTVTELSISETGVSISYESSEEGTDFELSRAGDIEFLMVDQDGNEIPSGFIS